jgi:hypothetical protein
VAPESADRRERCLTSFRSRVHRKPTESTTRAHHGGERGAGPAMIVWHATRDRASRAAVMKYLNGTEKKVASYHYLIDRDGAISRHVSAGVRPGTPATPHGRTRFPATVPRSASRTAARASTRSRWDRLRAQGRRGRAADGRADRIRGSGSRRSTWPATTSRPR